MITLKRCYAPLWAISALFCAALSPALQAEEPKTLKLGGIPQYTLTNYQVALSRDGKQLAYRTGVNTIGIFDPVTGKLNREVTIDQKEIGESLSFTADGKELVFTSMQKVNRFDATTGKLLLSTGGKEFYNIHRFVWNDDATSIMSYDDNFHFGRVPKQFFWNNKGEIASEETIQHTGVRFQAISGDGKVAVIGSGNHRKEKDTDLPLEEYVAIWNVATRKERARIHLGKGVAPSFLALNRTGRYLVTYTNSPDQLELWDTRFARRIAALGKTPPSMFRCTFSPDDSKFAIQSGQGYIGVFETETGKKVMEYQFGGLTWGLFGNAAAGVGFLANGEILACYGSQNRVFIRNISQKEAPPEPKVVGHTAKIIYTHWSEDGKNLLTVGADKQVLRWDTATGKLLETVVVEEPQPASWWQGPVTISPDGKFLVVRSVSLAKLYDLEAKKEVATLAFNTRQFYPHWKGFFFSEDGKKVFGMGEAQENRTDFKIVIYGGTVCWNTADGSHVSEFIDMSGGDWQKAFNTQFGKEKLMVNKSAEQLPAIEIGQTIRDPWASSTNIGAQSMGNKITLVNKATKEPIFTTTQNITGEGVSISPDGKRIALPMADFSVVLLDLPTGK